MMKTCSSLTLILAALTMICITPHNVFADDLQMTTYYPAPNGNYQDLTVANNLTVTNNLSVGNTLTAGTFAPAVITTGTLSVTGVTTLDGLLNADGGATVNGTLTANNAVNIHGMLSADAGATVSGAVLTASNGATVNGTLTANNAVNIHGALSADASATISGGLLTASNGISTTTLSTSGLATLQDLTVPGTMTLADLNVTGNAVIAGRTRTAGLGVGIAAPGSGVAISGGNVALNSGWINSNGVNAKGFQFSPNGRATLNVAANDVAHGPMFDVQIPAGAYDVHTNSTVVVRFGPTNAQSVNAAFQVNGSSGFSGNIATNGRIKAYKGITIGYAEVTTPCNFDNYGTLSYACTVASPTTCQLRICTPCNNVTGDCAGQGTGSIWVPIMTSQSAGGPGGGGIGPITTDPPID